jgi:hypothetical protein
LRNSAAAKEKAGQARTQLQRMALAAARAEREAAELRMQDDARRLGALTIARAGPIGNPLHLFLCITPQHAADAGRKPAMGAVLLAQEAIYGDVRVSDLILCLDQNDVQMVFQMVSVQLPS